MSELQVEGTARASVLRQQLVQQVREEQGGEQVQGEQQQTLVFCGPSIRSLGFFFFFLRKISPELTSMPIFFYFICRTPATAWLDKQCIDPRPGSELVTPGLPKWNA